MYNYTYFMKTLKVGFDLDGVILNNPLRTLRIFAKKLKVLKPIFFKQEKSPFYYPKTDWEKKFWSFVHKSSYRIDPTIYQLQSLVQEKKIDAYIISGRYSFLKKDF